MPRPQRFCPIGHPIHIIQRGVNRADCFLSTEDKGIYISHLKNASKAHGVEIHAWVLMSNHVHLLVTPQNPGAVSRMMQNLGREYVRFFNQQYSRTGTLWEGRFRSCIVDDENYFLVCQRYIELNPVRAGMVRHPGEYHWSSYHSNAYGRLSSICTPHLAYLGLGKTEEERFERYRALFDQALHLNQLHEIRSVTNACLIYGSESFKDRMTKLGCGRVRPGKRGPKVNDER